MKERNLQKKTMRYTCLILLAAFLFIAPSFGLEVQPTDRNTDTISNNFNNFSKGSPGPIIAHILEYWAKKTNQYYQQPSYELDFEIQRKRVTDDNSLVSLLIVDDEGDGEYTSIQAAINNASSGDAILVYSGRYVEQIIINKSLWLIGISSEYLSGNDSGKPLLLSPGDSPLNIPAIQINANNVTCAGFLINSTSLSVDISQTAVSATLFENEFICTAQSNGIYLSAPYCSITQNTFYDESKEKVAITINNTMHTTITNNSINGFYTAICFSNTQFNLIQLNTFNTGLYAIHMNDGYINHSIFTLNNFRGDNEPVLISNHVQMNYNNWSRQGLGNYWETYTGFDENNDGIGDTAYHIQSVVDPYPLILPFHNHPPNPARINPDEQGILCGKTDERIPFFVELNDPDSEDTLYGTWVFGNRSHSWIGPYRASQIIRSDQVFNATGQFPVSIYHLYFISKDEYGLSSVSAPYELHIYDLQAIKNPLLRGILDKLIPSFFLSGWQ